LDSSIEQGPFSVSSRVFVVGECDVRCDKDIVLYYYSRWDEDEGSNFAIVPNRNPLLNVHVRVDLRIFPDLTTVQIHLVIDARVAAYRYPFDHRVFSGFHLARIAGIIGSWIGTVRSWNIDSREASKRDTTLAPRIPSEWFEYGVAFWLLRIQS